MVGSQASFIHVSVIIFLKKEYFVLLQRKMPLFKIKSSSGKDKFIIKADDIKDIITKGKEKLKLSEEKDYKVFFFSYDMM